MDPFYGDPTPEQLAAAMQRSRQLGLLARLSGDRVLAPLGEDLLNDSAGQPKAAAEVMAYRAKRDEERAWDHPATAGILRSAIGTFMPNLEVPESAPPEVLRNILPTAEKYGGSLLALQGKGIAANTPHGRRFSDVTDPNTGERYRLDAFDGSTYYPDGRPRTKPVQGWGPAHAAAFGVTADASAAPAETPPAAVPASPSGGGPLRTPAPAAVPKLGPAASPKPSEPRFSRTPAGDIAKAIYEGRQPPDLKGVRYPGVRQELERNGFDLAAKQTQWNAAQTNVKALNSTQQTRLRQAIGSVPHMLDNIESQFAELEKLGGGSNFRVVNKATLAAAKQTPGRLGEVSQGLEQNIADLVSDLGTIYQGGNTPTEHALHLALTNLDKNWTPGQFREALKQIRNNVNYRRAAMDSAGPVGTGGENRYAAPAAHGTSDKPGDPLGIR